MLTRAYGELQDGVRRAFRRRDTHAGVIIRKERQIEGAHDVAIAVHTDAVFGPVITFGDSGAIADSDRVVVLPPLNERLVLDAISGTRTAASLRAGRETERAIGPLVRILLQISSLVCALPWVRTVTLDPVRIGDGGAVIGGARVLIDPRRRFPATGYRHMAIHPYPIELVGDVTLRDGTVLHVRPIRPEDAELELAFVNGLSEQSRYYRFFYRLHELTPAMLARFTQVDYDREMALVAVDDGTPDRPMRSFAGVARYTANPDGESAEFAIVVGDAWQGRGVAGLLMLHLIDCARRRGLSRLEGAVLRANAKMRRFCEALGFVTHDDPNEPEQVMMVLDLT
jgi:acetyltransferase